MSRRDVFKSLLRSAATHASQRISDSELASTLRRTVESVTSGRMFVADERLTAAVARVPGVAGATVSTREGSMRVQLEPRDEPPLALTLRSERVTFATHGAKEWCVRVEPPSAAIDSRCGDVVGALAEAVAHTLWGPVLRERDGRTRTYARREGSTWVVDLRGLPAVRAALGRRVSAAAIEAFTLDDIVAAEGGLRLVPRAPRLPL
jgi:hypothetical protein